MTEEYLEIECHHCNGVFDQRVSIPDLDSEEFSGVLALTCMLCGSLISVNINSYITEETIVCRGDSDMTMKVLRLPKCLPSFATAAQEK